MHAVVGKIHKYLFWNLKKLDVRVLSFRSTFGRSTGHNSISSIGSTNISEGSIRSTNFIVEKFKSTKIKYGLLSCKGSGQDKTTMQQTILIFELFPAPHLFQFQGW